MTRKPPAGDRRRALRALQHVVQAPEPEKHSLWLLHRSDIADTHSVIQPWVSVSNVEEMDLTLPPDVHESKTILKRGVPVVHGDVLLKDGERHRRRVIRVSTKSGQVQLAVASRSGPCYPQTD